MAQKVSIGVPGESAVSGVVNQVVLFLIGNALVLTEVVVLIAVVVLNPLGFLGGVPRVGFISELDVLVRLEAGQHH